MELDLSCAIMTICHTMAPQGATVEDCAEQLHLRGNELSALFKTFSTLIELGKLVETSSDRYIVSKSNPFQRIGIYKQYTKQFGFLTSIDGEEDIYIAEEDRQTAMHNDKVCVQLRPSIQGKHKRSGQVISIIERANEYIIGTFRWEKKGAFVQPDDEHLQEDIYIADTSDISIRTSARVLVKIIKWPQPHRKAVGKIIELVGYKGDKDLDIKIIMAKHQLPTAFSKETQQEALQIDKTIIPQSVRYDFRDRPLITIDSEDAKDLDDAIDVCRLANGNYRLGVYIADVSYYVAAGNAIDQEAYQRGTSVYLVDRVIPMLPEILSNDICSLRAGVDRYAMACVMEITPQGTVIHADIGPAIIHVKRRCNYVEIRRALEEKIIPEDLSVFMPMLNELKALAIDLKRMRTKRGAIDFDFPEYKVFLNEDGIPLRVEKRARTIAEQIVEECMLIANETVASYLQQTKNPSIYRVHDLPEEERVDMLYRVLHTFSLRLPDREHITSRTFQQIIQNSLGTPAEKVVQLLILRSMQQACYVTENRGHFGLASSCYTHFTSPIRRYPDLMVHRLLRQYWQHGRLTKKESDMSLDYHRQAALHASERERIAAEAERETINLKKAEYMAAHVGETYTAHITGITSFGLFVGLENGIEGLIHISYLTDDLYYFSEESYTLQSRYGGKIYRLGEEVEVTLVRVNVEKGEIDFVLGKIDNIHDLERIIVQKEKKGKKRIKKKSRQTTHDSFHAITHTKNAHHTNRHRRRKNGIHRRKKEWHKQK